MAYRSAIAGAWRAGRCTREIFAEVAGAAAYPFVYGIMSESIHGSWNESMDWCLLRNDDATFSAYALLVGVDARVMLPLVRYATPPYVLWIERIELRDKSLTQTLDRIQQYAVTIYSRFDELYDAPTADDSGARDQS